MISFLCGGCNRQLRVSQDKAGKKAKCPRCSQLTVIPGQSTIADVDILPEDGEVLGDVPEAFAATYALKEESVLTLEPNDPDATIAHVPNPQRLLAIPGASIPGFEIIDELGRGGMGVIFKAKQLQPRRIVALKMILSGEFASDPQRARFNSEAEAIARLQHPNIVQIHEVGEHNNHPYLTLEYVEGGNLAQYLKEHTLEPRRIAYVMQQLARAVHFAHSRGVIHRDLKPANILLSIDSHAADGDLPWAPKITDFGLAKLLEGAGSLAASGPATQSGAILGTPSYMAPEQVQGKSKDVGPAADVYALGAILYELLTGRPPFRGESTLEIIMKVAHEEPIPPRQLNQSINRDLETICLKCLNKIPSKRYESAKNLADDLRRYLEGEPIQARPQSFLERTSRWLKRRKELVFALGGAGIALVIVIVALALWNPWRVPDENTTPSPQSEAPILPLDLQLVPEDSAFLTVRVGDLWRTGNPLGIAKELVGDQPNPTLELFSQWKEEIENKLSLSPLDVERVTVVLLKNQTQWTPTLAIVRFTKPYDWDKLKKLAARQNVEYTERSSDSRPLWRPRNIWKGPAYCQYTDEILLVGTEVNIVQTLNNGSHNNTKSELYPALRDAGGKHHVVMGVSRPIVQGMQLKKLIQDDTLVPLFDVHSATLIANVLPSGKNEKTISGVDVQLKMVYGNPNRASEAKGAASALMSLSLNYVDKSDSNLPNVVKKLLTPLRKPAWQVKGSTLELPLRFQWQPEQITDVLKEANEKIVVATIRTQSSNNLKQLAIALHGYTDVHGQFPPAAITDKSGKPLLSWRVAILPYINQETLYKQFKLNESWDSPHNRGLMSQMPQVFQSPKQDGTSKAFETYYQVIVGKGTPFEPGVSLNFTKIADGTSNTLAIVEAAESVPWTKPADIEYDPKSPILHKIGGGIVKEGFNAALLDGSVHWISNSINESKLLRPLITYNDGVAVNLP